MLLNFGKTANFFGALESVVMYFVMVLSRKSLKEFEKFFRNLQKILDANTVC